MLMKRGAGVASPAQHVESRKAYTTKASIGRPEECNVDYQNASVSLGEVEILALIFWYGEVNKFPTYTGDVV
jgi:hypothetical protein